MSVKSKRNHHPKGITLLLTVLILSIVSSVALGVTILIIRQLQQGGDVKAELTAQDQADTGVERVLYEAKKARGSSTKPDEFVSDMVALHPCSNGASQTPSFCVKSVPTTTGETSLTTALAQDQSTTVDFYDPQSIAGVKVQAIEITGLTDPNTWLEVSWIGWTTDSGQIQYQTSQTKTFFSGSDITNPRRIYLIRGVHDPSNYTYFLNNPLGTGNCTEASATSDQDCLVLPNTTTMNYIVRVKALYGAVPSMTIRGLDNCLSTSCPGGGTPQPLPSRATVQVIGKSLAVQQALQVSIPWRTSLAGLYDYVLFSAGTLSRTAAVAPLYYSSGPIEAEQGATIAQINGSDCTMFGTVCASPWLGSSLSSAAKCTYNDAINANGNATCSVANTGKIIYPLANIAPPPPPDYTGNSYLNYKIRVHAANSDEQMTFYLGDAGGSYTPASKIDAFDESTATSNNGDILGSKSSDGWETCTTSGFNPNSSQTLVILPNPNDHTPQLDWFSITSSPNVKYGTCTYTSN